MISLTKAIEKSLYKKILTRTVAIPYRYPMPFQYKIANFRFLFNGAKKVCLHDLPREELNAIKNIANEGGFPTKIINKFIKKKFSENFHPDQNPERKLVSLQYQQGLIENYLVYTN